MLVWESIKCWAEAAPLRTSIAPLNYRELKDAVERCYQSLPALAGKRVGLLMGNRPLWGICDIALTLKGAFVVPIPTFFSTEQVEHIIKDSGIDTLVVDSEERVSSKEMNALFARINLIQADPSLETPGREPAEPCTIEDLSDLDRVTKVIYTSGTTGKPKGVMVTLKGVEAVTKSLIERSGTTMSDRHLSLLPLSTLVEAIGGLYRLIAAGATVIYPKTAFPPENILFNPEGLTRIVKESAPTTLNLVPSLLKAMLADAKERQDMPSTLRFAACGGAPLSSKLRNRAAELGVPLFEGYGLSECSSVVALNGAGMKKAGSVGKVLFHAGVTISDEGEIMVYGPGVMAGYTNGNNCGLKELPTGDMGYIDDEGYLFVTGRKDNLILTGQGRKVSPEWVEKSLTASEAVSQAMVYGNEMGEVAAVIVPDEEWLEEALKWASSSGDILKTAVAEAQESMPEYARVSEIILCTEPFSAENGFLGPDGRLNRKNILSALKEGNKSELVGSEKSMMAVA